MKVPLVLRDLLFRFESVESVFRTPQIGHIHSPAIFARDPGIDAAVRVIFPAGS
jgi:hypothetical protein